RLSRGHDSALHHKEHSMISLTRARALSFALPPVAFALVAAFAAGCEDKAKPDPSKATAPATSSSAATVTTAATGSASAAASAEPSKPPPPCVVESTTTIDKGA